LLADLAAAGGGADGEADLVSPAQGIRLDALQEHVRRERVGLSRGDAIFPSYLVLEDFDDALTILLAWHLCTEDLIFFV
jgi:CobQ-like glutamine amidotransferase family enzyme